MPLSSLWRRIREVREMWWFDFRHGTDTRGGEALADAFSSSAYTTSIAWCLWAIEREMDIEHAAFLDLGCGRGKALIMATEAGFAKVVGFEFNGLRGNVALQNLSKLQMFSHVHLRDIRMLTAFDLPAMPIAVYLFNPFLNDDAKFERLLRVLEAHPFYVVVAAVNVRYVPPRGSPWRVAAELPRRHLSLLTKAQDTSQPGLVDNMPALDQLAAARTGGTFDY